LRQEIKESALANPANGFSPSPFFSPPHLLTKAAKSGLRRKTGCSPMTIRREAKIIFATEILSADSTAFEGTKGENTTVEARKATM